MCELLDGDKSHKFIQSDGVTLACVVTFLSYYQIIAFIKASIYGKDLRIVSLFLKIELLLLPSKLHIFGDLGNIFCASCEIITANVAETSSQTAILFNIFTRVQCLNANLELKSETI